MPLVAINPGSGPVNNATEENAIENIKHFIVDNNVADVNYVRIPEKDYGEGRYAFLLWKDKYCHEIQMPGIPLEQVRFLGNEGQNIWHFPPGHFHHLRWHKARWQHVRLCNRLMLYHPLPQTSSRKPYSPDMSGSIRYR